MCFHAILPDSAVTGNSPEAPARVPENPFLCYNHSIIDRRERDNEKSRKVTEFFGFRYDRSYELTRPWDRAVKVIDSSILTRRAYLSRAKKHPQTGIIPEHLE